MKLSYVIDSEGNKKSVIISIKDWENIERGLEKLALLEEMKDGFKEIKQLKKGKSTTKTTQQLLDKL